MGSLDPLIRWRYRITDGFRRRRFDFFWNSLGRDAGKQWWLDLGGGPGSYLLTQLKNLEHDTPRVILLDTGENELRDAQALFPNVLCIQANGEKLPFGSKSFDLVFCNSVIEHVAHPQQLAAEIHRTGRRFFVQTPNENFPLESHSHVPLPFFRRMPRSIQAGMCRIAGASWEYLMSVRYLSEAELRTYFPKARVLHERAFGLVKSFYVLSEDA